MKRLGLILILLPIVSAADVVVPIDAVENNVNIRKSPEAGADIVGRLPRNEWLTLTERVPGWHGVELPDGATGYISADWTRVLDEAPATARQADPRLAVSDSATVNDEDGTEAGPPPEADAVDESAVQVATDDEAAEADTGDEPAQTADAVARDDSPDTEAVAESGLVDTGGRAPIGAAVETVGAAAVVEESVEDVDASSARPADESDNGSDDGLVESPVVGADEPEAPASSPTSAPVTVAGATESPRRPIGSETSPAPSEPDRTVAAAPAVAGVPTSEAETEQARVAPVPTSAALTDVEGRVDFLMKFTAPTVGGTSQVFDDGNFVGIGTTDPKQRLEVNGNIQINEQNSSVAGLLITQSGGETGYIMHNRASKLTIGAGSVDRITIDRDGNVGFGVNRPANPIELPSGAHVTRGGVWTNSSSRARKENIHDLSADEAIATLGGLEPVHFNYRDDRDEHYVGFIAEDVPELVATGDREGLSAMDIVAVLTKVVQEQQKQIEALEAKLDQR